MSEGVTCVVCFEAICKNGNNIAPAKCMHVFHKPCILKWIAHCKTKSTTVTCPECREVIPDGSVSVSPEASVQVFSPHLPMTYVYEAEMRVNLPKAEAALANFYDDFRVERVQHNKTIRGLSDKKFKEWHRSIDTIKEILSANAVEYSVLQSLMHLQLEMDIARKKLNTFKIRKAKKLAI